MTTIENLIGELLLRHNCVIVPSFGGFVAKKASAKIDFSSGIMTPPSKALLFNKQLTNNDGLLINELAQVNNISFDNASDQVTELTHKWNKTLRSGGRISLDKVGYLYADAEKNICFEQDRFFNLLLESFGMDQIRFVAEEEVQKIEIKEPIIEKVETPLVVEKVEEEEIPSTIRTKTKVRELKQDFEPKKAERKEVKALAPKPKSKAWRYVAAACILPFAFYSIWIPMKTDVLESGVLSINDFNPFHKVEESQYQKEELSADYTVEIEKTSTLEDNISDLPEDVSVYTYKYDDDLYIPVKTVTSSGDTEAPSVEINDSNEAFSADAMNFIVGCFGMESNATNLVSKLKSEGMEARIVDIQNGLHRVTAGSAISIDAFNQIKAKAISLGYKGWTLK